MCGIAGIFDPRGPSPIDEAVLGSMNDVQQHRGPDDAGVHIEPGVGLGHRRLSIIDLGSGHQPLYNEDGTVAVVYNGEIYNFEELAKELGQRGHRFRTHCDTEVIVHAWEEWGEDCVQRFRGMFAFALWDRRRQTLFMARDRLGIKPLYYGTLPDGTFVFGSELKALSRHPDFPRDLDPAAVEEYFAYGYVPEPRTIFTHAHKLEPGHTLTLKRGAACAAQPVQYWDVAFSASRTASTADVEEELIARLREAVKIRMVADVPLGAFLSGGVDSSAVVAMMAGLSDGPVNTCAISFGDPAFNEAQYAARVAAHCHADHHVEQVDADDYGLVDRLAELYDEPYADSSAIPTYRVCELARKRVTVALSGDGGDENFAGYRRYRWHTYEERLRSWLPGGLRRPLFGAAARLYPKADWAPKVLRAKSTLQSLARSSIEGYFHSVSVLGDPLRSRLFSPAFRRTLAGHHAIDVLMRHAASAPQDALSLVQYLDFKTYLPGDILTKVDRASMAHSLEVRVPILDHQFVEWVAQLPPEMKLDGREGKAVFKSALRKCLPDDILYRPKMGFAVPLAAWFRGALRARVRDAILGPTLTQTGMFDMQFLRKLVDQHQSGRNDHSAALWALLMFEAFYRRSVAGPVAEAGRRPMAASAVTAI
ncbi:MAG: XrtA/PEP-CTERM system amidotransferase [Gammaproteobacteria bacterium]